jgi:hypothetical protein
MAGGAGDELGADSSAARRLACAYGAVVKEKIMGTRHLIAVHVDGEYPVAQYGQWDGYPDGQGLKVLTFLRDEMRRDDLIAKAKSAREMTQEMRDAELAACGHGGGEWVTLDVSDKFKERHPQLSRDTGAQILAMVQGGEPGMLLSRQLEFAGESLMCQWAYVIDFDKNTFEVFKGFNKSPLDQSERFADLPVDDYLSHSGDRYYQVKLAHTWPLDALPDDDAFLAAFKQPEEDEEAA